MKHPEDIRTVGVFSYVKQLLSVAHAMIDDCRFEHKGDGSRIGGEAEEEILKIEAEIDTLKDKLRNYIDTYC